MELNLHSHLEGRLRPATAAALAKEAGVSPPSGGWKESLHLDGPSNLMECLSKVLATYPFFCSPKHVSRVACKAIWDVAADGTDYLELRFGPATHVHMGFAMDSVIAAACDGIAEGTRRTGIEAGLVIAVLRSHDEATNIAVAEGACHFAGKGVVEFDLAGDESLYPDFAIYSRPFAIARTSGLGLTCHAGEAAPGSAAREAVERFGVSRIGHGVHVAQDIETLHWVRDHGIVIECCPTSNWYTGGIARRADHPIKYFKEQKVRIVLGDDNPMQTESPLSNERRSLVEELCLTEHDLLEIDHTSVQSAFLENGMRKEFLSRLQEE